MCVCVCVCVHAHAHTCVCTCVHVNKNEFVINICLKNAIHNFSQRQKKEEVKTNLFVFHSFLAERSWGFELHPRGRQGTDEL